MSAFSGPQGKGAAKARRAKMRAEAEQRNTATPWERRAKYRLPCPTGKRKLDKHEAKVALVGAVVAHNRGDNHRQERRAYECPLCGWWHLTSRPRMSVGGTP